RFPEIRTLNDLRQLMRTYESPATFLHDSLNYNDPARSLTLAGVVDFLISVAASSPSLSEENSLRLWAESPSLDRRQRPRVRGFGLEGSSTFECFWGRTQSSRICISVGTSARS